MIKLSFKYLKGFARACAVLAPLAMLVEVLMDLQSPTLMAKIIDVGVANGDLAYVLATGLRMIGMAIIGFAGGAACSLFAAKASVDMAGGMRQGLFEKIQSLSFAEIDAFRTSSLVTRMTNDVMQMQQMVLMLLRAMVRSPIILLGSIVMSFRLSPRLAMVFCVILPIAVFSMAVVLRKSASVFSQVQRCLDRINTIMRENLLGARVVKAFTMEDRQAERFAGINDELTDKSTQAQNMTFLLLPVVTLTMNLSVVAILWFGGRMVISGSFPIGKIMAFINYLVQITFVLMNFTNFIVNISRAQASTARINEVLEVQPSITEPPEARLPANYDIEFRDVSFCYRKGGAMTLEHLSFRVKEGETLGIIGATGSGKSSLASLISRLYDVSSGQILIGGIDIRDLSLRELREKIGLVMQESLLFSGTIGDNLRFGDEYASNEEMNSASRDAQAYDFIEALPSGYDSPVEQRARNFSGGQKQRLSLARSLLQNPRILILDDSTSAVDLKTEAALRSALATRMRGRTMIVIAQRVSAVMDADQIIVLDFGRIAAAGGHEALLRSSEIYRNIAVSQLGTEVGNHG